MANFFCEMLSCLRAKIRAHTHNRLGDESNELWKRLITLEEQWWGENFESALSGKVSCARDKRSSNSSFQVHMYYTHGVKFIQLDVIKCLIARFHNELARKFSAKYSTDAKEREEELSSLWFDNLRIELSNAEQICVPPPLNCSLLHLWTKTLVRNSSEIFISAIFSMSAAKWETNLFIYFTFCQPPFCGIQHPLCEIR